MSRRRRTPAPLSGTGAGAASGAATVRGVGAARASAVGFSSGDHLGELLCSWLRERGVPESPTLTWTNPRPDGTVEHGVSYGIPISVQIQETSRLAWIGLQTERRRPKQITPLMDANSGRKKRAQIEADRIRDVAATLDTSLSTKEKIALLAGRFPHRGTEALRKLLRVKKS